MPAINELRKPPYQTARRIEHIDTLNFYRNNTLRVRPVKRNGRTVAYEQQVRWQTTDFTQFNGRPGEFANRTPIIAEAMNGEARHRYTDVSMHFEGQRFSEWDQADTQVLVVEAWEQLTAEQVTAYKAIVEYHREQTHREREARNLEKQARALRNQH